MQFLGPPRVLVGGLPVDLQRRPVEVLAFVALSEGLCVGYPRLCDAFGATSSTIRGHAHELRKVLGPEVIPPRGGGLRLRIELERIDVVRYESLLASTRFLEGEDKLPALREALGLWRPGRLFPDCEPLASHADRLDESRRTAHLKLVDAEIRCGEPHSAVASAERARELWPVDEAVCEALFRALAAAGRGCEIDAAFHRYAADAQREGLVVRGGVRAAARDYQRAGKPVTAKPYSAPYQLPPFATALRGRDDELERLNVLLRDDVQPTQVVTITGPAGAGKTALAVGWATRTAGRFADGSLHVDLAGFSGRTPLLPEEVLATFVRAFGLDPVGWAIGDLISAYRSLLRERSVLVVLDNAASYEQVKDLIAVGPAARTIITSRSALHIPGACEVTLTPLSAHVGLRLLADLIGEDRVRAEPSAAEQLVTRCGALPLALRIVAARTSLRATHSLRTILGELCEAGAILKIRTASQPSLREAFAWSYRVLNRDAAKVSHVIALHPGGAVSTEVIAHLAGLPVCDVAEALDELLGAHIVHPARGNRFAVHDMIREYALDEVETSEPEFAAGVREALLKYLLWSAVRCDQVLGSGRVLPAGEPESDVPLPCPATREEATAWLLAEHEAFKTVLEAPEFAAWQSFRWLLPAALCAFHTRSGLWGVSEQLLGAALEVDKSYLGHEEARFQAVNHRLMGLVLRKLGKRELAKHHLRQSVRLAEEAGARLEVAHAHQLFAVVHEDQRQWDDVLAHCAAALPIYEELEDFRGIAHVLNAMVSADLAAGRLERAAARGAEALAAIALVRDDYGKASIHRNVLRVHREAGAWADMVEHGEAAALLYRADSPANEARVLVPVAEAYRWLGKDGDARVAAERARALLLALPHRRAGDEAALTRLVSVMSGS
ncbi:DNA-binding SARP family transcriptional activator [Lentzea flaviverrucosa]|uniref:DNA-binding transcriptional activator of the SARP family n=2 Tax=Lentzea flaviverrucosa TaxID=200379 RepID=A0A1H9WRL3_9PSEU|nr:DNA-binding SARP family transcriptional activator [Lentzea flaviverrucosa]SES36570.1 DNA-binding transcriptional activator of the SARP family [Lentzea flaviverrucosa]